MRILANIQGLVILFFLDIYLAKIYINNLINSQYPGDKLVVFALGMEKRYSTTRN